MLNFNKKIFQNISKLVYSRSSFLETSKTFRNYCEAPKKKIGSLQRLLTDEQNKVLKNEAEFLTQLKETLKILDLSKTDLKLLDTSINQLEDLCLLTVVGEFNSGKSCFLNALLGTTFLKEGVTPTTNKINILRYGKQEKIVSEDEDLITLKYPVEWLKEITLVDTPGTNAVVKGHTKITEHFVPRSDLILFVTSSDRPFSESEKKFLEKIKKYKRKVVVVVSKIDHIPEEHKRQEILMFVRNNFAQLLGSEPAIYPVSAKLALEAKLESSLDGSSLDQDNEKWTQSNFENLENYVIKELAGDNEQKAYLKLSNPLGIAEHLISNYSDYLETKSSMLQEDITTLEYVETEIQKFKAEMQDDFKHRNKETDLVLLKMGERGDLFFDEKLRVTNIMSLLNSDSLKNEFELTVLGDTSSKIESHISEMIDWVVERNVSKIQSILEYLRNRSKRINEMLSASVPEHETRANLLRSIGHSANEVIDSFDKTEQSKRLSLDIKSSVQATAAIEVGAVGLAVLVSASFLDITGMLAAGVLGVTGLTVMPYKRIEIKNKLRGKIGELRTDLTSTLNNHFDTELQKSISNIEKSVLPFSQFVETEKNKLEKTQDSLKKDKQSLEELRKQLNKIF